MKESAEARMERGARNAKEFHANRQWHVARVVDCRHGKTRPSLTGEMPSLRNSIQAVGVKPEVLLQALRPRFVEACKQAADNPELRPLWRRLQARYWFASVLLQGMLKSSRSGAKEANRWAWEGLGQRRPGRYEQSRLEGGCGWLSGPSFACSQGARKGRSLLSLRYSTEGCSIPLGESVGPVHGRERFRSDVPQVPSWIRP